MAGKFTKSEKGWMMYDWANSAYSILSASILPIFAGIVAEKAGVDAVSHAAHWAWAVSLSALVIAVLAPILGAVGDYKGMRMRMFGAFVLLGVVATGLLPVVGLYPAFLLLFAATNLAFAGANVFYDSFLIDVTTRERMDKVSSWGFALGYIGGSTIPFVVSIALYMLSSDGMIPLLPFDSITAMKLACFITAVWWALFTIPFFKNVRQLSFIEREGHVVRESVVRTFKNLKEFSKDKALFRFFIAYFCYINGVGAIIMMASKLADTIGIGALYIIGGLFLTQIVAFPCSILYDKLGERFGHKNMILVGIATYILVSVVGFFMYEGWQFLVLACLVGTAQGGIQALSRSYFGKLIPDKKRAGEYFGFYNIFGKFESVVGTMLMAIVLMFSTDVHYGVIPVLVLFLIGGALMIKVPGDRALLEEVE
ncbi:MAG: MFS transporter [Eubacteriales bacterium]|nr:MFS transporter [Eubacteriales bacterium]